jgi:hypothetical protein
LSQADSVKGGYTLAMSLMALLLGLFQLTSVALQQWHHGRADYSVPVRALVVESTRLPVAGAFDRVWPRYSFSYHYLFRGELYVSSVYRHRGGPGEAVSRHPVGSMVTAWVDPSHPERAVIEPGFTAVDLGRVGLGLLLFLVGLLRFSRLLARDLALLRAGNRDGKA